VASSHLENVLLPFLPALRPALLGPALQVVEVALELLSLIVVHRVQPCKKQSTSYHRQLVAALLYNMKEGMELCR
jgi:hypothetical protein